MRAPFDVVVVGAAGVDTNAYLAASADLSQEGHFGDVRDNVGQAGAYTSRGYAQLGLRTAFVGHVGADRFGTWVHETLAGDGIDLRAVGVDPSGTARSVNLMSPDGSRRNVYDGRAHQPLDVPAGTAEVLRGARLAHVHLPDWARHVLPLARGAGCTVATDLQDARCPDDPYRRDFVDGSDVLFVSAAHLPDLATSLPALARRCRRGVVVCGMGADGVAVGTPEGVVVHPAPRLLLTREELPVVDTNGAGDALAVGFLVAHVLEDRPLEEAVLRGQLGARWTCAQRASSDRLVTRGELERLRGLVLPR